MFEELAELADELDRRGKYTQADMVENIIRKLAQEDPGDLDDLFDDPETYEEDDEDLEEEEVFTPPFGGPPRYEAGGLEADIITLPGTEMEFEEEEEDEDIGFLFDFVSFVNALAEGAYVSIEEAQVAAVELMEKYDHMMKDDELEEPEPEPTGAGQVIEFPGFGEE